MKIIIVGCGRLGSGLAKKLSATGHFVTVIDPNPAAFALLGSAIKCQTITGFGFDRELLLRAKIERTEALAAVTDSDDANIVIARIAKNFYNVPNVIARLCDVAKSEIYQRLGLQTIDPATWGINRVGDILSGIPLGTMHTIGTGSVEIVEIEVPKDWIGKNASALNIPGEIQLVAVSSGDKTAVAAQDTEFQEKDILHIAVGQSYKNHLKDLLGL